MSKGFPVFAPAGCVLDELSEDWDAAFHNRLTVITGDSYGDEVEVVMSAAPCANEIAVESHKRASPQFCYAVRRMNLYLCHAPARMGGTRGYFPMHYMLAYLIKHHRITKDDVLLANNALVYRSAEPGSDLRRDLQLLGRWAAKPAGPRLVWRETSPQEYPNAWTPPPPPIDATSLLGKDGTHFYSGSPAYVHWTRVFAQYVRSMPPPDPARNVTQAFECFWNELASCSFSAFARKRAK
eukprot:gene57-99_t